MAHEIVHPIEMHTPAVMAASRAFLAKRAAGESLKRLRDLTGCGYRADELTYEDEWARRGGSHYCGKLYSHRTGRIDDATASELLTMGIERLEATAFEFHRDDPDYFWFVLTTLQKL